MRTKNEGTDGMGTIKNMKSDIYGYSEGLEFKLIDDSFYVFSGIGTCQDVEIRIPPEYNGLPVKRICEFALKECPNVTSIIISDSVTSVGMLALAWGDNLTYNVYENAKYLGNEHNPYMVFVGVIDTSVTSCKIHERAKILCCEAFWDCGNLTSIDIPDGIISIPDYIFSKKPLLHNIVDFGFSFLGHKRLKSVTIGKGVTSIGNSAFSGCTALESITIPDSVTSIGNSAFSGCTSLKSITLSDVKMDIGVCAFSETAYYNDDANWEDGVLYIGNYLIEAYSNLKSCNVKSGIKYIVSGAFCGCEKLKSIQVPDGVTYISDGAFEDCESLEYINIPDSATSIGYSVFDNTAYYDDDANWKNDALYVGNHLIKVMDDLEVCNIKEGTVSIASLAFFECNDIESITIPDSVTVINVGVFGFCKNLKSVYIPDSVTNIGYNAFFECDNLTIYCEASSKPCGWDDNWNPNGRPVIWGAKRK